MTLGGDGGIRCTFLSRQSPRPWHRPIHDVLAPGSDPLSLFSLSLGCESIFGRLCAIHEAEAHKYWETSLGLNVVSCLDQILPLLSTMRLATQILSQNMSNVRISSWFLAYLQKSLVSWDVQGPRMDVWLCIIRQVQITQCLFKPNSLKVPLSHPGACPDHVQSDLNLWHLFSNCFYQGTNQW